MSEAGVTALGELALRDAALASEIRTLLEHDDQTADFLGTPALGAGVDAFAPDPAGAPENGELVGQRLGPYRLTERIAFGGMGRCAGAAPGAGGP